MSTRFLALTAVWLLAVDPASAQTKRPPRKGRAYAVTIDSAPQQATIYLDDKAYGIVGYTPYHGRLVTGTYKLILEVPGFKPSEQEIEVGPKSLRFVVKLEKGKSEPAAAGAMLEVKSDADPYAVGAQVFVNGEAKGTVPVVVPIGEGRMLVEVKRSGFGDFSRWIVVKPGERAAVSPVLKSQVPRGGLLVDADVPGAAVLIDGKEIADTTPAIVDNLEVGRHTVEVRRPPAPPWKTDVEVKANVRTKVRAEVGKGPATVKILSNRDDAEVWLDGDPKGKAPVELADVAPGLHAVEVRAPGWKPREEKLNLQPGQSSVVKIDLTEEDRAAAPAPRQEAPPPPPAAIPAERRATARFVANVPDAEVLVDGQPVGRTPLTLATIDPGEHAVVLRRAGYADHVEKIRVEPGGETVVNATLQEERGKDQGGGGLSSFGANPVAPGHFTFDAGTGYPYYIELRGTMGLVDGWDAALEFRTLGLFGTWEFLASTRFRLIQVSPFSLAGFFTLGAGGGSYSGRGELTIQGGGIGTLRLGNLLSISARAWLDIWSDRLCKEPVSPSQFSDSGPEVCRGVASAEDTAKALDLTGGDLFNRDAGARFMLSVGGELAITQRTNLYMIFEWAPFQQQRAGYSNLFTSTLAGRNDPVASGRVGLTFKF